MCTRLYRRYAYLQLSDERNSDDKNGMRWQNPENRDMGITTSTYWAAA